MVEECVYSRNILGLLSALFSIPSCLPTVVSRQPAHRGVLGAGVMAIVEPSTASGRPHACVINKALQTFFLSMTCMKYPV